MENFTPISALAGGLLIGLAAALLIVLNGRVAGVSGIVGGALETGRGDLAWRLAFLAGLLAAPLIHAGLSGAMPRIEIDAKLPVLVLAGILVGFGARLGAGCTSGHGVCGMARLSPRSIAATAIFMAAAFVTVFVTRHMLVQ